MDGGGDDGCASDGDEEEGAGRQASRNAEQYGQPGYDILESRTIDRGGDNKSAGTGDKEEGNRRQASLNAKQYG
jgi:hypothetical protein